MHDKLVGKGRFRFIGFPLKIKGGSGSPIRAVAVLDKSALTARGTPSRARPPDAPYRHGPGLRSHQLERSAVTFGSGSRAYSGAAAGMALPRDEVASRTSSQFPGEEWDSYNSSLPRNVTWGKGHGLCPA